PAAADAGPDLAAEARVLAQANQKHFGAAYRTRIDAARHLVYVSAADARTLDRVVAALSEYADAQAAMLFPDPLPWNVTVVLPTLTDYRASGVPAGVAGYYNPTTRTLTSLSASNTLIHEFTHALEHADEERLGGQRHAAWVQEGLATLFQRSRIEKGKIEVLPDASLAALQQAAREGTLRRLADLVALDRPTLARDAKACYPHVRHVMLYLLRQGRLKAFYAAYKDGYASDPTGAKALEAALGKPLDRIEADWRGWLLGLEPPWTPARPPAAHLGIRMGLADQGVKVTALVRGSAAEQGGVLKVNDVVVSVAGQATGSPADLTEVVRGCGPGEVVEIEIIREDRVQVVSQALGAVRQ
ncbi:MAG: PDZ domain-containing protein, partial [Planctomycetes bacterium]|nr:PDZ domain-containing protein [Planctomycetota bacterium]